MVIRKKRPRKYTGANQHFHNFEHSQEGRTHCTGPASNPYKIEHVNGKHKISHKVAKGHGKARKTQWFEFEEKLGDGYNMTSGKKVKEPSKRKKKQR